MKRKYKRLRKLGEGAHGIVYQAIAINKKNENNITDNNKYDDESDSDIEDLSWQEIEKYSKQPEDFRAIKKIRLKSSSEGLSMEAIREIKLLQELDHPNIMKMHQVYHQGFNVHIVLDFMETDLEKLILSESTRTLHTADIKSYMKMLLEAVNHCHENWVLHRDLKPSNLLLASNGILKLSDFGLAKIYGSPERLYSHQVCTLWYRSPELLFGARSYGSGTDIWSIGCIFAQLMLRRPLFHGDNELSQLSSIFGVLGTPNENDWPEMMKLPNYIPFEEVNNQQPLLNYFHAAPSSAVDLLSKMLYFNPSKRITAKDALKHIYFSEDPAPTHPKDLPRLIRNKN